MRYVYLLRSVSHPGQRYIGVTSNLNQRLTYHNSGSCPHTSKFVPWKLIYRESFDNDADAFERERQIKGWTMAKKDALVAGDRQALKKLAKRRIF